MGKKTETFVHQSRNGFYVIWDGEHLQQARGLNYRDLEGTILESETISEKTKVEILKELQEITTVFKGSPPAEVEILKRVYGADYKLGTKVINPRSGKVQIRVRGGWKDLE